MGMMSPTELIGVLERAGVPHALDPSNSKSIAANAITPEDLAVSSVKLAEYALSLENKFQAAIEEALRVGAYTLGEPNIEDDRLRASELEKLRKKHLGVGMTKVTTSLYYADGVSDVRFFDDEECAAIHQAREADVVIDDRYRSRDVLGKISVTASGPVTFLGKQVTTRAEYLEELRKYVVENQVNADNEKRYNDEHDVDFWEWRDGMKAAREGIAKLEGNA